MPAHLSHARFCDIKAWVHGVRCASLTGTPLPPPILPPEAPAGNIPHNARKAGQLQIGPLIPQNILANVNQQIFESVGRHDTRMILGGLPNPTTRPLNNRVQPDAVGIIKDYYFVMEIRDLLWVWQMILERQLRCSPLGQFSKSTLEVLEEVQMMVRETDESVKYIMRWSRSQGWAIDFTATEKKRLKSRGDNHPCNLIRPFIQSTV